MSLSWIGWVATGSICEFVPFQASGTQSPGGSGDPLGYVWINDQCLASSRRQSARCLDGSLFIESAGDRSYKVEKGEDRPRPF